MTTPKGRDTRDRIVRAAAALMYERGVARTSTEDVCTAAGVSSSQLYHYFADKRALTHAVIEHQTAVVLGMQEPMLARLDSLDAVRAWADTIVAAQRAQHYRGCPLGSLAGELADHDKDARSELARSYQRWQRAIRDGLATMVQNGELRGDVDVERVATSVLATLQGGLLLAKTMHAVAPLETSLAAVVDHIGSFAAPRRRPARRH